MPQGVEVRVLSSAPKHDNSNPLPIGNGFGFVILSVKIFTKKRTSGQQLELDPRCIAYTVDKNIALGNILFNCSLVEFVEVVKHEEQNGTLRL